jgi:hypothetical protein
MSKIALAVALGAAAVMFGATGAPAAPAAPVRPAAMAPVSCSTGGVIRVNVPYVPYAYCYRGLGRRVVNITQAQSIQSGNWTITFLWQRPGGPWLQSSLTAGNTFYLQSGTLSTISSP